MIIHPSNYYLLLIFNFLPVISLSIEIFLGVAPYLRARSRPDHIGDPHPIVSNLLVGYLRVCLP